MATLISTLGTEPQVVTTTLDLLLRQQEQVDRVVVIHTSAPGTPLATAVEVLRQAFTQPPYLNRVTLELRPISDSQGKILSDVRTIQATKSAFRELYLQVHTAKRTGQKVHLCIAGGRKNLAIFGMVTAQMLFDAEDRLWYLYSGGEYLASKRLHPRPHDEVELISIPVILWSQVSPVFTGLGEMEDPFQAIERIRQLQLGQKISLGRAFMLEVLSPAERRVVELLVQVGASDQEIAAQLHLSPRTVEQHLRSAYAKAADHWALEGVNRAQLIALLNLYSSTKLRENPHDR